MCQVEALQREVCARSNHWQQQRHREADLLSELDSAWAQCVTEANSSQVGSDRLPASCWSPTGSRVVIPLFTSLLVSSLLTLHNAVKLANYKYNELELSGFDFCNCIPKF